VSIDDDTANDSERKKNQYHFDRHKPEYRTQFQKITEEIHDKCPVAWTDTYDGHWVAGGSNAVFELARCPVVSNDHDINAFRYRRPSAPAASVAAFWKWTNLSTASIGRCSTPTCRRRR
jgi:hypothetical protein